MAKVNITISDDLLKRIDEYADDNYTSRSGLISIATAQYLNANETMGLVKNLSLAIGKKGSNIKLASRLTKYHLEIKTMEEINQAGNK